jgi:hypothetical protein
MCLSFARTLNFMKICEKTVVGECLPLWCLLLAPGAHFCEFTVSFIVQVKYGLAELGRILLQALSPVNVLGMSLSKDVPPHGHFNSLHLKFRVEVAPH